MSELSPTHNRTIALGGIFQSLLLVQQAAHEGTVEAGPYQTCLEALLTLDSDTTEAVFRGRQNVRLGLKALANHIEHASASDVELSRYWISVHSLERKLHRKPLLLDKISQGLRQIKAYAEGDGVCNESVIAEIAHVYKETLSTLSPRILVSGERRFLEDPAIAQRVRGLLLCAIRCAVLWRQVGGTRVGLLFSRRAIAHAAKELSHGI